MKRILSAILSVVMLCSMLAMSASMADTSEGVYFDNRTTYAVTDKLPSEPVTVETELYFNRRLISGTDDRTYFGNLHSDKSSNGMDLSVTSKGAIKMRIRDDENIYTYLFDKVNVFTGKWVNVAVVRDVAKKEARCYINGELAQTVAMLNSVAPLSTWDFRIGGNMEYFNPNPLTKAGSVKTVAVYSDVRTDKEIKSDIKKVGTAELILHYDFSGIGDNYPVTVADKSKYKIDAKINRFFTDEPVENADDYAYTFAFIGDTQTMAKYYPDSFIGMYNYIYDNIDAMNIEAVLGLGDISDTLEGVNAEWDTAIKSHKIIDDYVLNIPVIGDHDSIFRYNKFVSQLNYAKKAVFYSEGDYRDAYVEANIGGVPYLFIQFRKGPGDAILNWANKVVSEHPNHNVIITTHAYIYHDRELYNANTLHNGKMDNYADAMWDKFISKHENIVMVVCGHVGHDYVVTNQRKGEKGNIVTEVLIDFQSADKFAESNGYSKNGLGAVNLFHFSADGKKVTINTYSTTMNKYYMDINQVTLDLDTHSAVKYVKPEKAPTPPRSEAKPIEIKMTINSKTAYVNGEAKELDAAPINRNSRTLLPVRFLAENLGADVTWNDATKTATLKTKDVTIDVTINAKAMKVNGADVALDSPAIIENSRTYLPLRAIANALGVSNDNISWDDATKTATFVK